MMDTNATRMQSIFSPLFCAFEKRASHWPRTFGCQASYELYITALLYTRQTRFELTSAGPAGVRVAFLQPALRVAAPPTAAG